MQRKQDLKSGVTHEFVSDMKKQELYRVRRGQEILGKNLTEEEYFDLMEDLAQQFYDGDLPNPLDLITEIQNKYEE
jgi:hypothetical protein